MANKTSVTKRMKDYVRAIHGLADIEIDVLVVSWRSQTPSNEWRTVGRLPLQASKAEVANALQNAIADENYFSTCEECGDRLPCGMTSTYERYQRESTLCHGCAQSFGVVF